MSSELLQDIKAWRSLTRHHMPDWEPTLAGLLRLDEGPQELLAALRSIGRGWSQDDARWDVLQTVVEFYKRQHAHELAERIRNEPAPDDPDDYGGFVDAGADWAANLIDPEVSNAQ